MKAALLIAVGAILAVGPATASRESRDAKMLTRELAGRTAGIAERCVANTRLGQATIYGETLLYRDGKTVWLNKVERCPGLFRDPILVFDIFGGQLCENDLVRTIDRGGLGIPGPACQLGKFTPYRKPA